MYSSSGSARRASSSSQSRNSSRISSWAASVFRASLSPPGSDCSYCRPVACSHSDRACQYSALNRQMQLSRPSTQDSRASPAGSSSARLISASRSMPVLRRRSTAISVSVAPTGLATTGSRKFCLYWIQSHTRRSRDKSAGGGQTAPMIGPSAARAAADSRSFLTGRRSTSTMPPRGLGAFDDVRDGLLVPGHQQVHPGHAGDLGHLLDDLGGELDALGLLLCGRHFPEASFDGVGHLDAGHVVAHVLQSLAGGDRPPPRQDRAVLVQPQVTDVRHPPGEGRDVEHELGLDELRAGFYFLG